MKTLLSRHIIALSMAALLFAGGCEKNEKNEEDPHLPLSGTDVTGHFINL